MSREIQSRQFAAVALAMLLVHPDFAQLLPDDVRAEMDAKAISQLFPHRIDTGRHVGVGDKPALAYYDQIQGPGAQWMRLYFSEYDLGAGSFIILTAPDGAEQRLDAHNIGASRGWSAFFNGDTVSIALYVAPEDAGVFVASPGAIAGRFAPSPVGDVPDLQLRTLCGPDDRVASTNSRVCRITFFDGVTLSPGCTGWLVSNGGMLTAGHCVDFDPDGNGPMVPDGTVEAVFLNGIVEFNVPASQANGTPVIAAPQDQFPINAVNAFGFGGEDETIGDDFAVFTINVNATTGENAHLTKGYFRVTRETPLNNETIRVTGFGTDNTPTGTTGGDNAQTLTNQTSTGPYQGESSGPLFSHSYQTDTTGGNSGSPIIWEAQSVTIGIHTNAGCTSAGTGANAGTSFEMDALENALNGFAGPSPTHVDQFMPLLALEDGTVFRPWLWLPAGAAAVADGGTLVIVGGDYTRAAGNVFTMGADGRAFMVVAPVGNVVIGD